MRGKREEGRGKGTEGRGKRAEGRGQREREEGRGTRNGKREGQTGADRRKVLSDEEGKSGSRQSGQRAGVDWSRVEKIISKKKTDSSLNSPVVFPKFTGGWSLDVRLKLDVH
jgi:hypothetical protein